MEKQKITRDMALGEIVSMFPESAGVMMKHGLHCIGCHVAAWETLEEGAKAHGMTEEEIEQIIEELNQPINKGRR